MKGLIFDLVAMAGLSLTGYGTWLLHPGLAYVAGGLTLLVGAFVVNQNAPTSGNRPSGQ